MGCALGLHDLLHYCLLVHGFQLGDARGGEEGRKHFEVDFGGAFGAEVKSAPGWELSVQLFPEGEVEVKQVSGAEGSGISGNEVRNLALERVEVIENGGRKCENSRVGVHLQVELKLMVCASINMLGL